MSVVSYEIAQQDINRWLDAKRVNERKRSQMSQMIDNLVSAVCDGYLTVDPDEHTLIQKLEFESAGVKELRYKLRISALHLEGPKKMIKGDGLDDNINRILVALTDVSVNAIRNLDLSTDKPLADSIATFFL